MNSFCVMNKGGGKKKKRHMPHHLFAQRLYSTIHSYLASLANHKLPNKIWTIREKQSEK